MQLTKLIFPKTHLFVFLNAHPFVLKIMAFTNITTDLALPLTLINGPCQQILAHRTTDGVVRQWAELIRTNASKISDLVGLIHSLTGDPARESNARTEWVDVSRLTGNIAQTFFDRARANEVDFQVSVVPNLLFPSIPHLLMTIINLMIANTFDRNEVCRSGSVSLLVERREERLRIAVSTQSRKLDREVLFLISDLHRFLDYLGSDHHVRPIKNDMELAICYSLVDKLHGEFDISDDGASLVVSLPQQPVSQVMPEIVREPEEAPPAPDELDSDETQHLGLRPSTMTLTRWTKPPGVLCCAIRHCSATGHSTSSARSGRPNDSGWYRSS